MARGRREAQLSLFDAGGQAEATPELLGEEAVRLAARLPGRVHLGTSSWTFSGWGGLVYPPGVTTAELRRRGLELYARCPLFRTVGVDRTYYRPLRADEWRAHARQLPPDFPCVIKCWAELTRPFLPGTTVPHPAFLDLDRFQREIVAPLAAGFAGHVGAIVLQLPPLRGRELGQACQVLDRLQDFLRRARCGFPLAVELRNRELVTEAWASALQALGALHCFGLSEFSPSLAEQAALPGVLDAERMVVRLSVPQGHSYAARRAQLQPFDRRLDPRDDVLDAVAALVAATERQKAAVLVVINNKLEGSSPRSVRALAERLAAP